MAKHKVSRRKLVYDVIKEIGSNCTIQEAAKIVKKKHHFDLTDPLFYTTRKAIREEDKQKKQEPVKEELPAISHSDDNNVDDLYEVAEKNVASLVQTAKQLINHLGKEEAKRLIDAL